MKKTTINEPVPPADQVSHLDEKISQWTVKSIEKIQRYWIIFAAIAGIILIIVGIQWGFHEYRRSQEAGLSGRIFNLILSDAAKEKPTESLLPELEKCMVDIQGKPSEKWHLKQTVDGLITKLLDDVEKKEEAARAAALPAPGADPVSAAAPGSAVTTPPALPAPENLSPAVLGALEKWLGASKSRFADDADIQVWADNKLKEVERLKTLKIHQPPENRSFKPVAPPAAKRSGVVPAGAPQDGSTPGAASQNKAPAAAAPEAVPPAGK